MKSSTSGGGKRQKYRSPINGEKGIGGGGGWEIRKMASGDRIKPNY